MSPFDLSACLDRVRQHDQEASRALIERLYPLVIRIVRSHLPRRVAEEDLAQEIFVKLFDRLARYTARGGIPFEHWVSRLAVRTCLDALRAERRRPEWRHADLGADEVVWLEHMVSDEPTPPESSADGAREIIQKLLAGFTATATQAQDRLSQDEALRYADLVGSVQAQLKSAPAAAAVDLRQPVAVRDGEYGLMILPAVKLSADTLAKAGAEVIPVGQLWLLRLAPLVDDQVVGNERLQMVTVSGSEGSAVLPCCNLGVRQADGGGLELVVFGKGKEPILKAPIAAIADQQTTPLDLKVERESDRGRVTVKLAGKYAASIAVTDPELF